jgi:type IV fimbrial biogenesis protein FimT
MDDTRTEEIKLGRHFAWKRPKMMKATAPHSPKPAVRINVGRTRGFTIVEVVMTIAIAAILMSIAIPSFRYITNSNRIASELNGLLGDLQLARSQAIKEGHTVTVCQSTDAATCTNGINWEGGWIVFSDPTNVGIWDAGEIYIRKQKPFSGTDTFRASNAVSVISFNREGYAMGMALGTLITLHDSTSNSAWTRCLSINLSGQMLSQRNNGVTCI